MVVCVCVFGVVSAFFLVGGGGGGVSCHIIVSAGMACLTLTSGESANAVGGLFGSQVRRDCWWCSRKCFLVHKSRRPVDVANAMQAIVGCWSMATMLPCP